MPVPSIGPPSSNLSPPGPRKPASRGPNLGDTQREYSHGLETVILMSNTSIDQCGILLLSYGDPVFHVFAVALASSIKEQLPDLAIAIATDRCDIFSKLFFGLFEHIIDIRVIGHQERRYAYKYWLDVLTPFDRTFFIDVDVLLVGNIIDLVQFDNCKTPEVSCAVRLENPNAQYSWWFGNDKETSKSRSIALMRELGVQGFPTFNSSVIYFTRKGRRVFECMRSIQETVHKYTDNYNKLYWADEPVLSFAMKLCDMVGALPDNTFDQHKDRYLASFQALIRPYTESYTFERYVLFSDLNKRERLGINLRPTTLLSLNLIGKHKASSIVVLRLLCYMSPTLKRLVVNFGPKLFSCLHISQEISVDVCDAVRRAALRAVANAISYPI